MKRHTPFLLLFFIYSLSAHSIIHRLNDEDRMIIKEHADTIFAYIPEYLKETLLRAHHYYTDLDIDTFLCDQAVRIAPYDATYTYVEELLSLIANSDTSHHDISSQIMDNLQRYLSDLESNKVILDNEILNLEEEHDDAKTKAINLFNTNAGTALMSAGEIAVVGGSNINTSGDAAIVTINLNNSISVSGSISASAGLSATGGAITLNSGTNALSISTDAANTTVGIATGAGVKTTTLGSTGGTSSITIQSGTGGIFLYGPTTITGGAITLTSGTGALNISTDAANTTVKIATGSGAKTVTLGSTGGASSTTIQSGTNGISLKGPTTVTGGAITLNSGTSALSMSTDATSTTVNIATGSGAKTVTLGSTGGASSTTIQSGTGGILLYGPTTVTGGAITLNSGTGALSISTDAANTTVNIATGSGIKTTTLGSTGGASSTTIQSGTGGIFLNGTATTATQAANDDSTKVATTAYADGSNPYILLSTQTVSAATDVEFLNLPTKYTSFQVKWYNLTGTDSTGDIFNLQFSTSNGSAWIATGAYGSVMTALSSGGSVAVVGTSNGTRIPFNGSNGIYSATAHYASSGECNVTNIGSTQTIYPCCYGITTYLNNTGTVVATSTFGGYVTTATCNAFRMVFSNGSIASGTFELYGVL